MFLHGFSQFPSQVACVLNSPFLQHVLTSNPDFVMLQRLNFWLNHSLYEGNHSFTVSLSLKFVMCPAKQRAEVAHLDSLVNLG